TERIYKAFYGPPKRDRTFFHGHSYTAHPLGAAAALATLRLVKNIKLIEKTRHKAHILKDELRQLLGLSHVESIRQAGLMAGVELSAPPAKRIGAKICKKLLSRGIWVRPLGDTIVLMPPPVISDADLRRMVRQVGNVILHEFKT